jgi:cell division protein FtsL
MLIGIVAMQVELLKLNADTGRSIELIGSLQSRNDLLRAQVASASDPNRIERLASHMGMTMPGPESITFVKARSANVSRALARIRVPNLAAFEAALRASSAATSLPTVSPSSTSASAPASGGGQGPPATGP